MGDWETKESDKRDVKYNYCTNQHNESLIMYYKIMKYFLGSTYCCTERIGPPNLLENSI